MDFNQTYKYKCMYIKKYKYKCTLKKTEAQKNNIICRNSFSLLCLAGKIFDFVKQSKRKVR